MSRIKKATAPAASIRGLVDELRHHIDANGAAFASKDTTNALISLEGLTDVQQQNFSQSFESMSNTLGGIIDRLGFNQLASENTAGAVDRSIALESASIIAMAHGDVRSYAEKAYRGKAVAGANVTLVEPIYSGVGGAMDYRDTPAMESYDEREFTQFMPYSIVYNVFAARQDEFGEMFYPTVVVAPDNGGIDVTVNRLQVYDEVRHALTGKPVNFRKRNLIDAAVNPEILADETTRLVPVRQSDNSNAEYFVPAAVVAPYSVKVSGVAVPTAPLVMGKEIDVLGASQYQPLIGAGVMDSTDSIDGSIVVDSVVLQVAPNAPGILFDTKHLTRNHFNKSIEGNGQELNLHFPVRGLIIDKDTVAVDGSDIDSLSAIAGSNLSVHVAFEVNGTANVEFGNVKVWSSPITVTAIYNADGTEADLGSGVGATVKAAVEALKVAGYTLKTNRTNTNKRTRGLLLDNTFETERYIIPLGSPISVPAPVGSNREASDLKSLIAATRIRNSNNAVTQLFNYADQLEAVVKGPRIEGLVPQVQGMGRYLVQPFFERHELDLEKSINSIKSHEKAADISSVLINAIRELAYRMYRDSKIQAALDTISGGTGEKPTLLVGTDQILVRHLIVSGDTRTFGTVFDKAKVESTMDKRMRNKIVLAFGRDKADGPDPLNFGTHAWMPELTGTMPITRNGATNKETTVQPRTVHFNNCPVMAIIDVQNLSKVMVDKIQTPATDTTIDQPYMDGLTYP